MKSPRQIGVLRGGIEVVVAGLLTGGFHYAATGFSDPVLSLQVAAAAAWGALILDALRSGLASFRQRSG